MKRTITVILSMMLAVSLCTCGKNGKFEGDKIVMTYVTSPLNIPTILDKENGIYKDAFAQMGYGFDYSNLDSGADQTAALASGDIQLLNGVGGSSVLLAAANGMDIVILSMYSTAPKAFAMYSNDENINSPEDLRGLTVAGPKGTNLHELLAAYLATAGMTIEDVNFVSMDIPSSVAALEGGSVDVALVGGAASYNAEQSGKHLVCDGEGLIAATICTATTRKFAEENPEIIKTFLDTQNEIVDYMNDNYDISMETAARVLDIDEEAVASMYEMYDFSTFVSDEDIELLGKTEQFLFDSKMIENHVNVKDLFYGIK